MYKILATIFAIIFISACIIINSLAIKEWTKPGVSSFNKALAKEYKNFAFMSLSDDMLLDYLHFILKSTKAASGEEVLPEDASNLELSESASRDLNWADNRLSSFMLDEVKEKYPDQLAHCQMLYDCWATGAAKKIKSEKTASCRIDFILEMLLLENRLMPVASSIDNR